MGLEARIKKAEATLTQHEDLYGKQGATKTSEDRTWFQSHKERMEKKLSTKLAEYAESCEASEKKKNISKQARKQQTRKDEAKQARIKEEKALMKSQYLDAKRSKKTAKKELSRYDF